MELIFPFHYQSIFTYNKSWQPGLSLGDNILDHMGIRKKNPCHPLLEACLMNAIEMDSSQGEKAVLKKVFRI